MTRCVALIPAYNEVQTIRAIVAATLPHVDAVIVIDDGSTDGTAEALEGSGARVIRHAENRGKGPCLVEGLDLAVAEGAGAVITLDGDDQHDPADIPAFRARAAEAPGALVLGDRSADMANVPKGRGRSIRLSNFFIGWGCARRITDAQCGMRLYPAAMWRALRIPRSYCRGFVFETALLLHAADIGTRFVTVPVRARYGGHLRRASHFRPVADFVAITLAITRFIVSRGFRPRGLLIALGLLR
ncbi:glycosyltransferase family 2 protein [Paralimibaculum aggregatum]|uniref:Glycosyltransferase family 2 protein n=1 Tax=Paralimibaculum aggregatum TaxID=3036245 RepID=A0ABQ6LSF7_9RHOB|nr:glycosyltransferase family 2 protein [Limibaculum sp. NKW23]GMG85007.1 glycosyltransferase family 2 protein [Limibaculum sp. NKW23]